MKIAIISPWNISENAVGGTERFVMDLASQFAMEEDCMVDIYTFSGDDKQLNGIKVISLQHAISEQLSKINGTHMDEYLLESLSNEIGFTRLSRMFSHVFNEYFKDKTYDLMIINTLLLVQSLENFKRLYVIHTNPFEFEQQFGVGSYNELCGLVINDVKLNTTYVTPSLYYASILNKDFQRYIYTIPHSIEVQRLENKQEKEVLRTFYNMPENKIVVLLPSRLEPIQKQPELAIDAIHLLERNIIDKLHIIFTGKDEQYNEYSNKISQRCKNENISHSIQYFTTMTDAYALCDVVILPSRSESFGYSLLEALSLNIPTFINNIPTFHEIADGYKGYCQFFNDASELSNELNCFISNFPTYREDNRSWLKKYDMQQWIQSYWRIIREIK